MYAEIQNWSKIDYNTMRTGSYQFVDNLYLVLLHKLMVNVQSAYQNMRFRDVVQYGFYELQSLRNKYENPHLDVYKLFLQAELASMWPIIPHWAEYLSNKYSIRSTWPVIKIDPLYDNEKTQWLAIYCQIIGHKLANVLKKYKKKSNPTCCSIIINNNIGNYIDQITKYDINDKNSRKKLISSFPKQYQSSIIELVCHFQKYSSQFSMENLITWLCDDHREIIKSYFYVCHPEINFAVNLANESADPLNPVFNFS